MKTPTKPTRHLKMLMETFRKACRPPARGPARDLEWLEVHLAAALDVARDTSKPAATRLDEVRKRLRLACSI